MPGLIASLGFLAATGLAGVAIARRWFPFLVTLEAIAYGIPLGVVLASVAILVLAFAFGLTPQLVALVGLAGAAATIVLWPRPWAFPPPTRATLARIALPVTGASLLPALVLGALALRWLALWLGALRYERDGLWAGHINIWGDWPVHLGILTSFAYGANFPPEHPRFAEHPLGYHYLADLTPAALVQLGADPVSALALHSFLFSVLVALGVYAFARRLGLPGSAAALVVALFFVGGGLGWLVTLSDMLASRDPLGALAREPWNSAHIGELNVRWQNMYFGFFAPQRAFLYGLPLGLLVLTSLLAAVATRSGAFLAAGIVAGLLPLAHLPTMLALAIVTPVLFALFPSARWLLFFGAWGLLAAPQLLLQQGPGPGPLAAFRLQTGWIASPDPWPLFWLKNLGAFVPLAAAALLERALLPRQAVRLLWAFMPIFVVLNLVVFQPWDWDNHKAFVYWFLAVCILTGAFLARTWELSSAPVRIAVAGLAATMLLSGTLENVDQLLGRDRHLLLTAEEVALAAEVRARTDPRALFVIGLQSNHPVGMLSGRRVLMGYPGWLWTEGLPTGQRERDVRAIYGFTRDAPDLLARYRVDYVVIGPVEREQLRANVDAYRSRFPELLRTASYQIFDVRRPAVGGDRP